MSSDESKYEAFSKRMEETYPKMFSEPYGGFCIGEGWWPIVESLCKQIQSHIDWTNKRHDTLKKDNQYNLKIPRKVKQVVVGQIKEKFGSLRFYYDGGDSEISGMVRMAESWAANACEQCGDKGKARTGGWIKTLCDTHEKDRQDAYKKRKFEEAQVPLSL
jgi:hypothetical protein